MNIFQTDLLRGIAYNPPEPTHLVTIGPTGGDIVHLRNKFHLPYYHSTVFVQADPVSPKECLLHRVGAQKPLRLHQATEIVDKVLHVKPDHNILICGHQNITSAIAIVIAEFAENAETIKTIMEDWQYLPHWYTITTMRTAFGISRENIHWRASIEQLYKNAFGVYLNPWTSLSEG